MPRYVRIDYRNPYKNLSLDELVKMCNQNGFIIADLPKPKDSGWGLALKLEDYNASTESAPSPSKIQERP
jgi:hypothetical protein